MQADKKVKFLEDDKIYLSNVPAKSGSERVYGIVADEMFLLVCEIGAHGSDAKLVVYKSKKQTDYCRMF